MNGRAYTVEPFSDGALNVEPGSFQYSLSEPETTRTRQQAPPPSGEPPRKRLRKDPPELQCTICYADLEGAYSTPCRVCKAPRCFDCLKREFEFALKDHERMPAKCCSRVLHHEVADQILSPAKVEAYRLRFDEHNTPSPLYCPVPTCSIFIPPRTFPKQQTKVTCPVCSTVICTECKQTAEQAHVCDKNGEREAILKMFKYKSCPKCGTGVAKMFGCPHVRCQCGAHWCWDCQRAMSACYVRPCRAAREDGQGSEPDGEDVDDDEDAESIMRESTIPQANLNVEPPDNDTQGTHANDPEGEVPINEQAINDTTMQTATVDIAPDISPSPQVVATEDSNNGQTSVEGPLTTVGTDRQAAVADEQPVADLDDPDELEWDAESWDFGEEPVDEPWDIWGCQHRFRNFERKNIPDFWLYGRDPKSSEDIEIDCLACFKKAKVWDSKTEEKSDDPSRSDIKVDIASLESTAGQGANAVGGAQINMAKEETILQVKKPSTSKCAFECRLCMAIYCGACKRGAINKVRKQRVVAE